MPLRDLIHDCYQLHVRCRDLWETMRAHIDRATARLPGCFFELGERNTEAIHSLTNRVYVQCRETYNRYPFSGRAPFAWACQEEEDAEIRKWFFYARLSVTREIVRRDFDIQKGRDPKERLKSKLYAEAKRTLMAHARVVGAKHFLPQTYQVSVVRSVDEVRALLVRSKITARTEQILECLRWFGRPVTPKDIMEVLLPMVEKAEVEVSIEAPAAGEYIDVRQAVERVWNTLSPEDKCLILLIAHGHSAKDIIARDARLKTPLAVNRALERIGHIFLREIIEDPDVKSEIPPTALIERIVAVLWEMYPDLDDTVCCEPEVSHVA